MVDSIEFIPPELDAGLEEAYVEPVQLTQVEEEDAEYVEPIEVAEHTLSSKAASSLAAQFAIVDVDTALDGEALLKQVEEDYVRTLQTISDGGYEDLKDILANKETAITMSIFELEAREALERGDSIHESLQMAVDYQMEEAVNKREVVLEEAFADRMMEMLAKDPDNAPLVNELIDFRKEGRTFDRLVEMNRRTASIERLLQETVQEKDQQSLFMWVFNGISSSLPGREWYQLWGISPGPGMQGDQAKALVENIYTMDTADVDNFIADFFGQLKESSALVGGNPNQMVDIMDRLTKLSDNQITAQNIEGFLDFFDVVTIGGATIGKYIATKALMLTRFGQRKLADDVIIKTLDEAGDQPSLLTEATKAEASDSAMLSGVKSLEPPSAANVSNALSVIIKSNTDRTKRIIESIRRDERILPEDKPEAIENALANLRDEAGANTVADVRIPHTYNGVSNERGVETVSIAVGDRTGQGWRTIEEAESIKEIRKLPYDTTPFRADDGLWYLKLNRDVLESFVINNKLDSGFNPLSKWIASPASTLPKWLMARASNAASLKGMYAKEMRPVIKTLASLNLKHFKQVNKVVLDGNIKSKWYNRAEFDERFASLNKGVLPTDKQWDAYNAFINLNDIDYGFRNWDLFVDKLGRGFQTASIKLDNLRLGRVDLKKLEGAQDTHKLAVYDADSGTLLSGKDLGAQYFKDKLKEGYELYHFGTQHKLADNTGAANSLLIKRGQVKPGVLQYKQLPYRAGGHRGPEGTFFTKQAVVGAFAGGGKYLLNPLTHAVGRTRSSLEDYTKRMNEALDAYKTLDRDAADAIIRQSGIEGGYDELDGLIEKGLVDRNHRFTIVEHNENPAPILGTSDEPMDLREVNSFTSFVETQGRPYYGKRGDKPLQGPDDEVARLIDPINLLQRSLTDSLHKGNLANYRTVASNAWINTFGSLLRSQSGMSKHQIFFTKKTLKETDFDSGANKGFIRAAINQHAAMQTQLSQGNEYGRYINGWTTRVANFIDKKGGERLAGRVLDWREADPIVAMRSLAYNVHLGLFQVDQLVIQSNTALSISAMDPTRAPVLLNRGLHFQMLNRITSDSALEKVAKTFKDPEDFKEFVRIGRERGIVELFGDMGMVDHNSLFNVGGTASAKNLVERGRMFVMAAERYNKSVGYAKAWDELRNVKGLSLKDMRSTEVQMELTALADKYSMNMGAMSAARWQKGVMGVPTQFLSYPVRFLENMTTSSQWTPTQKVRLGLTQAVLYGYHGIPLVPGVESGSRATLEAMGLDPEEHKDAYIAARGGAMDWALKNWLGIDSSMSNRVGLRKGYKDLWDKMNGEDIGNSSLFDVGLGPSGALVLNTIGSVLEAGAVLFETARAEQGDLLDVSTDLIKQYAAENISSANDVFKAYWAFKTGEYISARTGKVLVEGISNAEALGFILGLTPNRMIEAIRKANSIKDDKEAIKSAGKILSRLRNEELRYMKQYIKSNSTDEEARAKAISIWEQKNILLGGLPDAVRMRVRSFSDAKPMQSFEKIMGDRFVKQFTEYDGKTDTIQLKER